MWRKTSTRSQLQDMDKGLRQSGKVKPMRVAGYTRVSTSEQAIHGLGLSVQRDKIQAYCDSQSWDLAEIYEDAGISGATMDRPALRQMIQSAEAGEFDLILIYKIDRISRSLKSLLILVEDTLAPMGVGLKSVTESFIDTSSPEGMAMFQVLGTFSELERKQITRKLRSARDKKFSNGGYAGGHIPFGYDVANGKLVVNDDESKLVRRIFQERKAGASLRKIAKALNDDRILTKRGGKWSAASIKYVLGNELYTGRVNYNSEVAKGSHVPIISRILFNKVQL